VKSLFPHIEPFEVNFLEIDDHKIYYEVSGNPNGKPAIFVHGGPGGGGSTEVRRFFNPELYKIVVFDQRGCGRSKPHASLKDNTTWHLVSDMETIRERLSIEQWLVFGGSWGSTLSLAYAQAYPTRVSELVLRGIFMLRKKELDWFYQEGASKIFPEPWQEFLQPIQNDKRDNLMDAYREIFYGDDQEKKLQAAVAWSKWEAATSSLLMSKSRVDEFQDPEFALAFAMIENHYFVNKGFFKDENQLLENLDAIRHIPAVIVQGRYDVVCPLESAWELASTWPEAEFIITPNSGHSAFEQENINALIDATDSFASS
jgi:proline iminopeptidase